MKIFANIIDDKTEEQLRLIESQEAFKDEKIRIMPDCHSGKGCVIGFTSTLGDKIIPNIVGVDIGCGVIWSRIPLVDFDLPELDAFIKKNIPSGMNVREADDNVRKYVNKLRCKDKLKNIDRICGSIGTLGGGNHFIEVDADEDGNKYLVVHTGSRNLGKQVAEIYQSKAIENLKIKPHKDFIKNGIEMLKDEGRQKEIENFLLYCKDLEFNSNIPNELCYLEGQDMEDYFHDMEMCQVFAGWNRSCIMDKIFGGFFDEPDFDSFYYESVHNYIDFDDGIIRKGAIKADMGRKVIIPLNMRDGCILGTGKGNFDWNCSAPHGAGRIMSRGEARRELKLSDFQDAMKGIYTTTATQGTIDESPMVYKNAKEIIDIVKETVIIDKIIKPIYNFKAEE